MAMIHTTHGELDESLLDRKEINHEDDDMIQQAVEYRLKGSNEIVRRDLSIHLKRTAVFAAGESATF